MRTLQILLLAFFAIDCQAQSLEKPVPNQVVVNGSVTDTEAGRDFIAGKIVVGKQRIAESGLQNVGELLRREPAISIGKDGRIGLLGLPGYTQVLVDGMPHTGDAFSIDLIHIERIEIIKTSTAATGPLGIAGTINIIKKKTQRQALTTLRLGTTSTGGYSGADVAWSTNQIVDDTPFSYNLRMSASYKPSRTTSSYFGTQEISGQRAESIFDGSRDGRNAFRSIIASSEFAWSLSAAHKLSFSPDIAKISSANDSLERRHWVDGRDVSIRQRNRQPLVGYSLPLRWNWQIDADSSLTFNANVNRSRLELGVSRLENWFGASAYQRINNAESLQSTRLLSVDFNTTLDSNHELSAGVKLIRNTDEKTYVDLVNGQPDISFAVLSNQSISSVDRRQLFVQDEWRIDKTLALNLGMSVEQRRYSLYEDPVRSRVGYTMWSPSAHIAKKIQGNSKRQFRLSFARSFNAPHTDQMLLHPNLSIFASCTSSQLCSANSIDTADSSGNPYLQPERARSLNASYKHGIGKDSELTLEFYRRDIRNKIGFSLGLEQVPWASVSRYVYRPANLGAAQIRGIDLEARLSGNDIAKSWKNIGFYGSVGWADSQLSDIPGPDNRVEGQVPWRAKFGGAYTMQAVPLKLSIDSSYLTGDWIRSALSERTYQSNRLVLSASANWQVSSTSRIIANIDNFLQKTNTRIDEYSHTAGAIQRVMHTPSDPRFSIRFETRL